MHKVVNTGNVQKPVYSEFGKSLIMPAVTVNIPMPQGAAVPAQPAAPQAAAPTQGHSTRAR